ncbi:hypothetical protein GLAREA_12176 [Glarea lozoyensis ATCC 20868]|uniref:Uncharacterized protein n=2 Tax=Glarea lozoyensis TaxID=101852 RepID=S3D4Q9_GLAL2|nr:uncharacterized protein GLAREA_12176 [Glarea lozoyensis ATCC 20868]EHK97596.1 hypothetical protein M7I_6648 [Glarea lozoyensis 74030]EPE32094.1 hypothetical protein GLAREA_12176 [Glarea lozoyensis ATCC 20868]
MPIFVPVQCEITPLPRLSKRSTLSEPMLDRKVAHSQAWFEAMLIVQGQLAQGTHPEILERRIKEELNRYTFVGIPTLGDYEEFCPVQIERLEFEIMMYYRFNEFDSVLHIVSDADSMKAINDLPERDFKGLRAIWKSVSQEIENKYMGKSQFIGYTSFSDMFDRKSGDPHRTEEGGSSCSSSFAEQGFGTLKRRKTCKLQGWCIVVIWSHFAQLLVSLNGIWVLYITFLG